MKDMIGTHIGHAPDTKTCVPSDALVASTLVGVEVELENIHDIEVGGHPIGFSKRWVAVHDGSLRNGGVEFVLREPLGGKDLVESLMELERGLRDSGRKPLMSERTSVHIHLDIRSLTVQELRNLIILYTIFEKVLFKYAGKTREHNIFCASFADAQALLPMINTSLMQGKTIQRHRFGGFQKYASCNLLAILDHGSLEFRHHSGEFRAAKLLRWINILMSMHKYAQMKRIIPKNLGNEISLIGLEKFTRMVFGKFYEHLEYPEIEMDILEGIRLSQDLIHMPEIEENDRPVRNIESPRPFAAYLKKLGHEPPEIPENIEINIDNIDGIDMDWVKIVLNRGEV